MKEYRFEIVYSPKEKEPIAVISTDVLRTTVEALMWLWKLEANYDSSFTLSIATIDEDGYWKEFNDYNEADSFMQKLDIRSYTGTKEELINNPELDGQTDKLFDLFDILDLWTHEKHQHEVIPMEDSQRMIFESCVVRDDIKADDKVAYAKIAGWPVEIRRKENGYALKAEDLPEAIVHAVDMRDAIDYLPEYLDIPELVTPDNIEFTKG